MGQSGQQFRLPDGRLLGYDDCGPRDGIPVFYNHGTPSARVEWSLFIDEVLLHHLKIRLIAPDRPGLGLSTFQPERQITNWPADLIALADHLDLPQFAVLGYSAGSPYALVCALAIPERLTGVGVVSGSAPFNIPGLADGIPADSRRFMNLAVERPWLSRLMVRMMAVIARYRPAQLVEGARRALPEPDQRVLARPEVQEGFLRMVREAARQGPRGPQWDTYLMVSPWPFELSDVRHPVTLWHGEEDQNAPPAMGEYLAATLPDNQAHVYPSEGHISLFYNHHQSILAAVTSAA